MAATGRRRRHGRAGRPGVSAPAPGSKNPPMRRLARTAGLVLAVAGALTLAWAVVVWRWQDPFTALYTTWQQHRLQAQLEHEFQLYAPHRRGSADARARRPTAAAHGQAGSGDRPHRDPPPRPEHDPGQRHRRGVADSRPGTRPALLHAGREPPRLHRRPPDDVPRPLLAHRLD